MLSLNKPILTELLENRPACAIVVGAAAVHGSMLGLGLPTWQCPIQHTLGIPCPGCGLSRAVSALLVGDWQTSVTYHAFAPLLLAGLLVIGLVALLPAQRRGQAIELVRRVETRTGVVALAVIGLVVYWLARLVWYQEAFIHLIAG